jgi:hypothetical protein
MVIKFSNIFYSKALQTLQKLVFLFWKQTIWQPWCWFRRTLFLVLPTLYGKNVDVYVTFRENVVDKRIKPKKWGGVEANLFTSILSGYRNTDVAIQLRKRKNSIIKLLIANEQLTLHKNIFLQIELKSCVKTCIYLSRCFNMYSFRHNLGIIKLKKIV